MTKYILAYITIAVVLVGLDMAWLRTMGKLVYQPVLAQILADNPNAVAAVLFYVVYAAGILYFAVAPAAAAGHWTSAVMNGALLGLLAYGTYDFTNWATLRGWPPFLAFLDIGWGMVLSAFCAGAGFWAFSAARLFKAY